MDPQPILVLTTLPDRPAAERIAMLVLAKRLAACVTIGQLSLSLYHWKAKIETAHEVPVTIKTVRSKYTELEALLRAEHSYELPEVIAVPIIDGLDDYLSWLEAETSANAA